MSKGTIQSEGDRKKQAGELVKNADKLLKSGDAASAFEAIEQALQLDPGNLYAQAYRERIRTALAKSGVQEPAAPKIATPPEPVQEPAPKPVQKSEPPKQSIVETPTPPPAAPKHTTEQAHTEAEASGKLRKLAAIMFTDMVAYTSLSQTNESLAIKLLDTQQKLIRPVFKKFDGKEIKTVGDAFLAEFVSVLQAVRCAIEIQKAMSDHTEKAPKEQKIQLRIGIHLGDIIYKDNDIYGDGVNIAARIQALANPGGIYVSQDVYNQIRNRDEFIIEYVGEVELKHIITPLPIYRILTSSEIRQKNLADATQLATSEGTQEAQSKKIDEFLAKAKELAGKESFQEALIEVTKILQIIPQHPEARLVESQIRNKRIESIGKQIDEAKRIPHTQERDYYKEALQYAIKAGELSEAEKNILKSWRTDLNITEQEHEEILGQLSKT